MQNTPLNKQPKPDYLMRQIFVAMLLGAIIGLAIKFLPLPTEINTFIIDDVFTVGGTVFINLIKMLVVPLVFISLLCGICSLDDTKKIGEIGIKAITLFIITTSLAVMMAVILANIFNLGSGLHFPTLHPANIHNVPSLRQFIIDIFPSNPFQALNDGNILQIIIFTLLFGIAINKAGEPGKRIVILINDLNVIIMRAVMMMLVITPIGVFFLITILFAKLGLGVIIQLLNYFLAVVFILLIQTVVVYSSILKFIAKLSPRKFFSKMYSVLLFSFSISSSNAALPLTLKTVENKLGVDNSIASFVLSLGVNMNKNGTAIMQGAAAIFIANAYGIHIGLIGNLMIILTTTLAAISTAGAPSIGVLSLAMVLKQVGLPIEGIALILSVDRFLDMARTAVNVAGNAVIACVIGKSEGKLQLETYNN